MKAYQDQDYPKAVRQFQAVIGRFPGSALIEEAQWMLGKSYEAGNDVERALKEYQAFQKNYPNSSHHYESALRIDFLLDLLKQRTEQRSFRRHVGVILPGNPQKAIGRLENVIGPVKIQGGDTVVVEGYEANGVYFKTDHAPVASESIVRIVKEARAQGLKVWVRLPVRHLPWFKAAGEERDMRYDPVKNRLVQTTALDLFNSTVLGRLERFYLDLAATGVDGIVFDEDPWIDAWEGFGSSAQAAFLQDFGSALQPNELVTVTEGADKTRPSLESSGSSSGPSSWSPLFWRWAGWKNREALSRLEQVIKKVRERYPSLVWVHIIPPSAVLEPHLTLARSGIDLLEEKQHGLDYFAVPLSFKDKRDQPFVLLRRLEDQIGEAERVIVLVPLVEAPWAASHLSDFEGAGLLFLAAEADLEAPLTKQHP